jgi:polysaccharide biosynthesis/export protein
MKKAFQARAVGTRCLEKFRKEPMKIKIFFHHLGQLPFSLVLIAIALAMVVTGCETATSTRFDKNPVLPPKDSKDIILREADTVKITFPGTDSLNTSQTIRRDGKITLPIVGEVVAAGKTPAQFEQELVKLYEKELVSSKEITVTVQSASFPVFLMGAVKRPGKVTSDHPITVLEAIVESGGFEPNANLKAVRIIRTLEDNKTKKYVVNLKGVVTGGPIDIFYLQPSDIVYVPEKITWF